MTATETWPRPPWPLRTAGHSRGRTRRAANSIQDWDLAGEWLAVGFSPGFDFSALQMCVYSLNVATGRPLVCLPVVVLKMEMDVGTEWVYVLFIFV